MIAYKNQTNTLSRNNDILSERGILDSTRDAGWQDAYKWFPDTGKVWGWKYPLYDPLTLEIVDWFWKNVDSSQKGKKYRPFNGSLTDYWAGTWYIPNPAKVIQAIKDNDGLCYVANGAPSLLAFNAAGIYNVIAGRAETKAPEKLVLVLLKYNVTRVLYPVDNDKAGKQSGTYYRDALRESGIDFEALYWQTDKPKYDANDAWIESNFNPDVFMEKVNNCLPLELPKPKPKRTYENYDYSDNAPLLEKIFSSLGIRRWTRNGHSENILSPFREERHRNKDFIINKESGVGYDFGTGRSYSPFEIADRLGIPYEKPQKPEKPTTERLSSQLDLILYDHPIGPELPIVETVESLSVKSKSWIEQKYIPRSWLRSIMTLTDSRSSTAIVMIKMHDAFMTGVLNPSDFTMKEILEVTGLPRGSTTAAIKTLERWGFVRDSSVYSLNITTIGKNLEQNSKGGRPAQHFEIADNARALSLTLAEKLDRYVVELHTKDSIAPREHTLFAEVDGLNQTEYKAWKARNELLVCPFIRRAIKADMDYWLEELAGDHWQDYIEYDSENIDPIILRTQLFEDHLNQNPEGVQMSQHEICRLLGTKSTSGLDEILFKVGAISIPQSVWYSVENPNTADIDSILIDAARPQGSRRGGTALAINFKVYGGKWLRQLAYIGNGDCHEKWEAAKGSIDDLRIYVRLPNYYRFKTAEELEADMKAQQEAEPPKQAEIAVLDEDQGKPTEMVIETPKTAPKTTRRPSYVTKVGRDWNTHDRDWLFEQMRLEVYCWLNYELTKDFVIKDSDGRLIAELKSYIDVIRFTEAEMRKQQIFAPYHQPEEYFETDGLLDFSHIEPPF